MHNNIKSDYRIVSLTYCKITDRIGVTCQEGRLC